MKSFAGYAVRVSCFQLRIASCALKVAVFGFQVSGRAVSRAAREKILVIGDWNLDIVCDLLFGAWNFLNSESQLYLHILKDFFNVFVGHDTRPYFTFHCV